MRVNMIKLREAGREPQLPPPPGARARQIAFLDTWQL
jgi:hypothetical protein